MDKRKQIIQIDKVNKDILKDFTQSLQTECNLTVSFKKKEHSIFLSSKKGYSYQLSYSTIPNLEKKLDSIFIADFGEHSINWEAANNLLTEASQIFSQQASQVFQSQLVSNQKKYLAIIDSQLNQQQQERTILLSRVEESDSKFFALDQELKKEMTKNNHLTKLINSLEENLKSFQTNLSQNQNNVDYFELLKGNQQKLLADKSVYKLEQLREQLSNAEKALFFARSTIVSLEHQLDKANLQASLALEQEQKSFQFYSGWEVKRKEIENSAQEGISNFNRINLEKLSLSEKLTKSEDLCKILSRKISDLEQKIADTKISLNLNQKELEKITRSNLVSKLKLSTVLIFDTSRNFLPNSVGNYITKAETVLLASEVNSTSNQIFWLLVSFFSVFSFLLGILKVYKLSRFLIFKLLIFFESADNDHYRKEEKRGLTQ